MCVESTDNLQLTGLGVRHQIRLASQTGVAAGNINRSTLHSLLGIQINKKDNPKEITDTVCSKIVNVTSCFIDEISMTGTHMLNNVSCRLSDAKTNVHVKPFGGIDTIFAGDFYQLAPISGDALYKYPDVSGNENHTKALLGYVKFKGLTTSINHGRKS